MILDNIQKSADVKKLNKAEREALCGELRREILSSVSKNGGHLASNLGTVELTVALHKVFNLPDDKIVFDVGHQSYAHKLLTGRREGFENLRSDGGVSGFTKRSESEYDAFGSGHSGNALSAAIGIAYADKLDKNDNFTVAVIGDGGFTNGMTYEALNNCSEAGLKLIIVLNDNEMAISKNVGSIDNIFTKLRVSKRYFRFKNRFVRIVSAIPLIGRGIVYISRKIKDFAKRLFLKQNFFETLGLDYIGPVDGNDTEKLISVLGQAKKSHLPCVVHINTKKGLGYKIAEEQPDSYHSVPSFDLQTGVTKKDGGLTYSYNAGKKLCEMAKANEKICAVTAAMTAGTGLSEFAKVYPRRFFDVGIAEEHAATFCAGLSSCGYSPVFAVYSTFLQRAFDQIIEDAAMQNLKLTLLVDRAGIVGDDGITHHGIFDVSLLNKIPSAVIYSPDSISETEKCIEKAVNYNGVSAVRYPKGKPEEYERTGFVNCDTLEYKDFGSPERVVITYGRITVYAVKAAEKSGNTRVIKLIRIKPLDEAKIKELTAGIGKILFAEEGIVPGGIGEEVQNILGGKVQIRGINEFPGHGSNKSLFASFGLDTEGIYAALGE